MSKLLDSDSRPTQPVEAALAAAQRRVCQLEADLLECEDEILVKDDRIMSLEMQLEHADVLLDECAAERRKLQQRVDELEDEYVPPCPVVVKRTC